MRVSRLPGVYCGQPGSPLAANAAHCERIRSPSATALAGGSGPNRNSPRPEYTPNTSGNAMPWQAPKPPSVASKLTWKRKVFPPAAACAWARCSVGIRNSQSELTSSNSISASASG